MSYEAEISREHPTCFLFVIDQSGSMDERTEGGRSKSQFLADVLNKTIYTLVTTCTKGINDIRGYFDVGVVAYSENTVNPGFGGSLGGKYIQSIRTIAESPLRVEDRKKKVDDGVGGIVKQSVKFPVWFDPKNSGGTPMCAALTKTAEVLAQWCDAHPGSYPPTILHVTDGESTDGNPEEIASHLRQLATSDGPILLFNLHVTTFGGKEILFPTAEDQLPDPNSKMLFRLSSPMPAHMTRLAADKGYVIAPDAKGFIYNAGPEFIVDFFEIGTRPKTMAADR